MTSEELTSQICVLLGTMKGYPSWPTGGGALSAIELAYVTALGGIPPPMLRQVRDQVLMQFDERPSVKALREWAAALAPPPTFTVPPPRQLTGPAEGERPAYRPGSASLTGAGGCLPPFVARRLVDHLRVKEAEKPALERCEYGLQFEILPGFLGAGRISRTCPRMSAANAERQAQERNEKWPHQHTSVFRKDEPVRSARETETRELMAA
jgi:hypothetical protein